MDYDKNRHDSNVYLGELEVWIKKHGGAQWYQQNFNPKFYACHTHTYTLEFGGSK